MSGIDGAVLASGTKFYPLNDGTIRATTDRFGTGAKVGSVRLPDFKKSIYMYTKTEPSMSDEELKEAIVKIAREDAEKGQFHNMTKEWFDLKKEYMSSVSPDRESVITNSTKQINSIKQKLAKTNSLEQAKTLLQLLMDKEKSNNKTNSYGKLNMEGDKLNYAEFYGNNGEIIATYDSNSGWSCISTKEENARKHEFFSIYNEAWDSANAEIKAQKNPIVPKHIEGGTAFDAYA